MTIEVTVGSVFGRLTVIRIGERLPNGPGRTTPGYICQCECGSPPINVRVGALKKGETRSCGCLKHIKHAGTGARGAKHGMTGTRIYGIWRGILKRCGNPSHKSYPLYGGRGITVHPEWAKSFEKFYSDVGDPPTPRHTLDRKDPDGNYEPGNWRWATRREQANNRRTNVFLELNGVRKTMAEWAVEREMSIAAIMQRRRRGWSDERILTTPVMAI